MMRERRFAGDIRMGSPSRATLQGGRGYSPPRKRSRSPTRANTHVRDYCRDIRTGSPTRANMHGRDYSRNLRPWSPTRAKDYSGYFRTRSPTQASIQGGETRDYLRPHHGLGESYSQLVPGLSSKSSEMEKSRRVSSSEHPSGSMERSDYRRHLDEDSERQLQKLSQFSEGVSQIRLPSSKFLWKHLLDEPKRMNGNVNHSSKIFPDYGVSVSSTRVSAERNYQGSVFADVSRSGMRMEKPMAMHFERDGTFSGYPLESGTKRSSVDIDGSGLLLPSQKLNISHHKDEGLRSQDPLPADKLSARELYKQENITKIYSREEKHPFYSSDTSHCVLPSSQSKASTTVLFESSMDDFRHSCGDFPVRSDGLNISSGTLTEPITHEAYTRISHLNSSRDLTVRLAEATNFRQVQYSSPNDGTHGDYSYPEVRSEKSEVAAPTDKLYGKQASVQDDYGCRDILGPRIVEPITDRIVVTESSRREHLIEGRLWDHHYSAQEQPISNYLDAARPSYASKKDGECLDHRSIDDRYERELYPRHENIYLREDHVYGRDADLQFDEERLHMLLTREYDPGLDGVDDNHQEGFSMEDLDLLQPKRKLDVKKILSKQNLRSKLINNRKFSGQIHDAMSNKPLFNAARFRNIRTSNEMIGHSNPNSIASGRPSVCNPRHLKSRVSDIKKRLGPQPPVKKYKQHKILRGNEDGHNESTHSEEEAPLKGNHSLVKSGPSEKSEDFKQLVQGAFFKFVKHLHENPAQRRKFKEQGKAGSLKCSVCGSDSEEFQDTESLVRHACMALKAGLRAQHLGLHKALCSLMGWQSAEILNSQWVCQLLPDAETVAHKEDLIIWPPIVVVHNSSIKNTNPDAQIISIEMLESILRDMGFREKIKVCRGRPANQSIMVVKFNGTLSGLQEAEKLHKFYADNKHGRTEFQQINPNGSRSGDGETQKTSANKVEDLLYGYLGIAEDLDKLHFETKKWFYVKSKKGIQEIADAPLKTE
ncbi:suppressor of gene silencing like protein [Actinidia chinensis var. chinensis]|uniref:Suppressor of gene silencing like protein n=1 Tax=Actinidia chinensis var. chinensis TaxID=1590841 RepID=A0A2R6PER4_ACTCC|nr:suppressor of gene silencing like protein [Actinidia chinensis var. chinensis]